MSAPAATATAQAPEAPKKGGKKSMLMLIVVAVAMLGGGAGGAWYFLQKRAAAATDDEPVAHAPAEKHAPTYVPLESMVVNLADGSGERFAQIGVTLDIDNEKTAAKIKTYMPVIRSSVLMLVSQRTSEELLRRDGKEKLANDIVTEVSRAIGYEVAEPAPKAAKVKPKADDADAEDEEPVPKRKKKRAVEPSPINGVLFSSFIVQ